MNSRETTSRRTGPKSPVSGGKCPALQGSAPNRKCTPRCTTLWACRTKCWKRWQWERPSSAAWPHLLVWTRIRGKRCWWQMTQKHSQHGFYRCAWTPHWRSDFRRQGESTWKATIVGGSRRGNWWHSTNWPRRNSTSEPPVTLEIKPVLRGVEWELAGRHPSPTQAQRLSSSSSPSPTPRACASTSGSPRDPAAARRPQAQP